MSERQYERRTFASPEEEAEEVSRALPLQIARLKAEIQAAKARLVPTARERARDEDSSETV
jgi:hypothetical protein